MRVAKINRKIAKQSLILEELVPLIIPDFLKHSESVVPNVLAFNEETSEGWFLKFADEVEAKLGKEYLPIMRLSDGEYSFILGNIPPVTYNRGLLNSTLNILKYFRSKIRNWGRFKALTFPGVSSGNYSRIEVKKVKESYVKYLKKIAENGTLALHLTYSVNPFQEQYHYPLQQWLNRNQIPLHAGNYVPFYFVYALLRGSQKKRLLKSRKILIVHSATGDKKERIKKTLIRENVSEIFWLSISPDRSLFDTIDINAYIGNVDLVLVGAGIGKANILVQLEKLKVPCIDAGYVFEVWADEDKKWLRPFMVPDCEWEKEEIKFK
jgi:hypothetical protein